MAALLTERHYTVKSEMASFKKVVIYGVLRRPRFKTRLTVVFYNKKETFLHIQMALSQRAFIHSPCNESQGMGGTGGEGYGGGDNKK